MRRANPSRCSGLCDVEALSRRTVEAPLASWHLERLQLLSAGLRRYGRWDTTNAFLAVSGLITATGREVSRDKCEYALTEAGRAAMIKAQGPRE